MDTWIWEPLTFVSTLGSHWVPLMTGGFLILAFGLIERWLRRPANNLTFVLFGAGVLFIASFLAWRDQYRQNAGAIFATVDFPQMNLLEPTIHIDLVIFSTLRKAYVVREVALMRIETTDISKELAGKPLEKCKKKVPLSFLTKGEKSKGTGTDLWYLMKLDDAVVEGKDTKQDTRARLESGGSLRYHLVFSSDPVAPDYNVSAVCPVISFFDSEGGPRVIICEGAQFSTRKTKKENIGVFGPHFTHYEIYPTMDLVHCEEMFP